MANLAICAEGVFIDCRRQGYSSAISRVKKYFDLQNSIKKKGSQIAIQQVFDLKRYLESSIQETIMSQGLLAMHESGELDFAKEILDRVDWKSNENKPFGFMTQVVALYGKYGCKELFYPYAEEMLNNPQMKQPLIVALEGMLREYPERNEEVFDWWNSHEGNIMQVQKAEDRQQQFLDMKQKVQQLLNEGKVAEARELLEELKKLAGSK